jgi:phosphatidylglycerol:prolipoprotein diacylglycerol transferase
LGGVIALYLFTKRRNVAFLTWADLAAPALALGQAIGRWGNFVNQELYGAPTDLPWAIFIEPGYRLPEYVNQAFYHPLFLYESLWNLANALFMVWLGRKFADRMRPGNVFLAYLVVYPAGRILLEFLRLDASRAAGLNINQALMVAVGAFAILSLIARRAITQLKQRSSAAAAAE